MNLLNLVGREHSAIIWAHDYVSFNEYDVASKHPWGTVLRLKGDGANIYLKILPEAKYERANSIQILASEFKSTVPAVLASDSEAGFILFEDHKGVELPNSLSFEQKLEVIKTYSEIQRRTIDKSDVLSEFPSFTCMKIWKDFTTFLNLDETDYSNLKIDYFIGDIDARRYLEFFRENGERFRGLFNNADRLPQTLNHCDLRGKNLACRSDGRLSIFDWDDAIAGPPGLSLHNLFSGCRRPLLVLDHKTISEVKLSQKKSDKTLIDSYIAELCNGPFEQQNLQEGLKGSILAGVLYYVTGFSNYQVESESLRNTIGTNIRKRLDDLKQYFSASNSKTSNKILASGLKLQQVPTLQPKSSDIGSLPTIRPSRSEILACELDDATIDNAKKDFLEHGTLIIKDAISPKLVERCKTDFLQDYKKYLSSNRQDDALRVGDKRFMITVKMAGNFANPHLFAAPMVFPIIDEILGSDAILGSFTAVASLPGAADQRLHKDNPALFVENPDIQLPSFSIALIIPLISLTAETGTTRVVKGSHRVDSQKAKSMPYQDPLVDVGSCYLMDSRLSHQGLANKSGVARPILSIVFQRPWYRDNINYNQQKPLDIEKSTVDSLSKRHQEMLQWAL